MKVKLSATLLILLTASAGHAQELSLDNYLQQIESQNGSYRAALERVRGFDESRNEARLVFTPKLEALAQASSNEAYPNSPGFEYDSIQNNVYSLGLSQQFEFGLQTKLKYEVLDQKWRNVRFGNTTLPFANWNALPQLEFSMPLWQNGFGRSTRAVRDATYLSSTLEIESARSQVLQLRIQAQTLYWRLSAVREMVRLQEEAFARSQALLKFVEQKASLDLRDKSDVLQTRASVEANRLDLKKSKDEEKTLAREFNRLRGQPSGTIIEKLNSLEVASKMAPLPEKRPGDLPNYKISRTQLELTRANAVTAEERNKPELSIFGSTTLNGRDNGSISGAMDNAWSSNRISHAVGLRFSVPLDFGASRSARAGARIRQNAVEEDLQYQAFDQEEQWKDLVSRYTDAQERLKLAHIIQSAQESKLSEERRLMRSGRSSLFINQSVG